MVYDYLALLRAELERRGARYVVASSVENFDGELCGLVDGAFTDVRYTDRDALLVRADRAFTNATSGRYYVVGRSAGWSSYPRTTSSTTAA